MEFLDISWLGTTYWYTIKIAQKFKQKNQDFGYVNPKQGKGTPKLQNKGNIQGMVTQDNPLNLKVKTNTTKTKQDTWKWHELHNSPTHNTSECQDNQSPVVELKAFEWDPCSDYESETNKKLIYKGK